MSGYFTQAQIETKIQSISAAIETVVAGGRSYRLNDGMGDVQVTRESLSNLQNALDYWLDKYEELDTSADIISIRSCR